MQLLKPCAVSLEPFHVSPCTLRVRLRAYAVRRINVWSEKLPFAEYSVVKDPLRFAVPAFAALRLRRATFASHVDWLANRSSLRLALVSGPGVSRAKVGEYRARTGDLLVANQALSQLS